MEFNLADYLRGPAYLVSIMLIMNCLTLPLSGRQRAYGGGRRELVAACPLEGLVSPWV